MLFVPKAYPGYIERVFASALNPNEADYKETSKDERLLRAAN